MQTNRLVYGNTKNRDSEERLVINCSRIRNGSFNLRFRLTEPAAHILSPAKLLLI
jgi:hypothetical protein